MRTNTRLFAFLLLQYLLQSINGCTISLSKDIVDPQPLLLHEKGNGNDAFYQPDSKGTITIATNEKIYVACPSALVKVANVTQTQESMIATCTSTNKFKIGTATVNFNEIVCSKQITQIVRYTGDSCLDDDDYREIEMGFQVDDGRFLRHMLVCFDSITQGAIYSLFYLPKSIGGYQANYGRVDFKEGKGFYELGGAKVDNLYNRDVQRVTINAQLGLAEDDFTWVDEKDDFYLARGHLTAKTDFLYGVQQRLTFYYVNAAPQWQTLNAGNWLALENNVRDYASKNNVDLTVYTGTYGNAVLPNADDEDTELWLYVDNDDDTAAIPVPEIYWKVVYHEASKKGVAFIAVNNPYWDDYDVYCDDVCDQIGWLRWNNHDQKSGFAYCCDVNEFREVLPLIPKFTVQGLLK